MREQKRQQPGRSELEEKVEASQQDEKQEGREEQLKRKEELHARMVDWIAKNAPEMFSPPKDAKPGGAQELALSDTCGTYELLSTSTPSEDESQDHEDSGLSFSLPQMAKALFGRFRLGSDLHGLLKIPSILQWSSTGGVRFSVVIEDSAAKDGSWIVPVAEAGGRFWER